MNTEEVGNLLGLMALHDNRKIGPGDVMAWEDVLPTDMTFEDARTVLRNLRATSAEWIMPAHIITGVRRLQQERLQRAGDPPMPGYLTWQQEREWRDHWCTAVKVGMDRDVAAEHASRVMGLPADQPPIERTTELKALLRGAKGIENA